MLSARVVVAGSNEEKKSDNTVVVRDKDECGLFPCVKLWWANTNKYRSGGAGPYPDAASSH